jgi:hypothetical protein
MVLLWHYCGVSTMVLLWLACALCVTVVNMRVRCQRYVEKPEMD